MDKTSLQWRKIVILACTSIVLITAVYIAMDRVWMQKLGHLVNSGDNNFLTTDIDREIRLGSELLQKKAKKIIKYFMENQSEQILDISEGPIDKIIKIEQQKIYYYAIYKYKLGKGTYGTVRLAQDIDSKEPLAVKVQPYSGTEEIQDLQHEIRQLSAVKDYRGNFDDQKGNVYYLFCKFARGISVEKLYLSDLGYKKREILDIILSSFYSLKYIHDNNVIHNDVHEGNLVFNPSDKKSRWVDLAFGITLEPKVQSKKISLPSNTKLLCCKAPESNIERGYATDTYQLGFMSLRMLMILSENDKNLKRKYIDSREECLKVMKRNGAVFIDPGTNAASDSEPYSNIIALLFRMMDPKKEKRPTLTKAISEFEENLKNIKYESRT